MDSHWPEPNKALTSRTLFVLLCNLICISAKLESFEDCTDALKQHSLKTNNGAVQFQYTHYPTFWLYRSVITENEISESAPKEIEQYGESGSLLTILDIEMYPVLANATSRHFWSWKLAGSNYTS